MRKQMVIPSAFSLCLLVLACDPLAVRPGADFEVRLLSDTPLRLEQRLEPVELVFEVDGCDEIEVAVGHRTTAGTSDRVVEHRTRDDGSLVATVPVHWLVEPRGSCSYDTSAPLLSRAELAVTCRSDGRQLRSDSFDVYWAPAWRYLWQARGEVSQLFEGSALAQFFTLGAGWLTLFDGTDELSETQALVEASIEPLLRLRGDRAFLWIGCPLSDCGLVRISDAQQTYTSASYVYQLELGYGGLGYTGSEPLLVPGGVVDMAVDGQGHLVVLGRTSSHAALLAFGDGDEPERTLVDTQVASGLAQVYGQLVFLGLDGQETALSLYGVDGAVRWRAELPGTGPVATASLAPDGEHWALIRGGRVWLGQGDAWTSQLDTDLARFSDPSDLGLTWSETGLAAYNRERVDLFALGGATAPRFVHHLEPLEPHGPQVSLRRVSASGDRLLLSTSTGVRFLDEEGRVAGGIDPLPCGAGPSAAAVPIADGLAAVAFGRDVYLLDLSLTTTD